MLPNFWEFMTRVACALAVYMGANILLEVIWILRAIRKRLEEE